MGEECEEGGERAESCGEEDEEGELLLGVDGDLVERGQQLPVGALGAAANKRVSNLPTPPTHEIHATT